MSLKEALNEGARAHPKSIAKLVDAVLESHVDRAAASDAFRHREHRLRQRFNNLTHGQPVVASAWDSYKVHHPIQTDVFAPVSLTGKEPGKLLCYPIKTYEVHNVPDKVHELQAGNIRPITTATRYGFGMAVPVKQYGFMFSIKPFELIPGDSIRSQARLLEWPTNSGAFMRSTALGTGYGDMVIDHAMYERQEKFDQFVTELLVDLVVS